MITVDFATFCYSGDAHRLHAPGQLEKQVLSNGYPFNQVIIVYQNCNPDDYGIPYLPFSINQVTIEDIDDVLRGLGIDLNKPQYQSPTDKHHQWRVHVVNHLVAADISGSRNKSDYIVFADSDCWMIKNKQFSWVSAGIGILQTDPSIFIVSPNDGEPERKTQVMSQQMFMVRTEDFRQADFNQPSYSGNPRDYPEMPEYHAMLEGRMHYYCKATERYRYVLPPEYRYFHHNRLNEDGTYKTNYTDYGL